MKATIIPERKYTIEIGPAKYTGCILESEWNGLTAFKTENEEKIIVGFESDIGISLARMFDENKIDANIVSASPSVYGEVNNKGDIK